MTDDVVGLLRHAIATASNDDFSKAGSSDRARHTERIDVMAKAADEIDRLTAALASEREARQKAIKVLRDHHRWHCESGTIGLPDGEGGWIEMDNAAEYGDSRLYERTVEVLDNEPPESTRPTPRGGMASNHWENWVLAVRELRKAGRERDTLRARVKALEEARINREDLAYLSRMFGSVADLSINQPGYRINEWLKTLLSETA